jgi:hypothetical protein
MPEVHGHETAEGHGQRVEIRAQSCRIVVTIQWDLYPWGSVLQRPLN